MNKIEPNKTHKKSSDNCCSEPFCENCLLEDCKDKNCQVHTMERKIERRILSGLLFGGRIGYHGSKEERYLVEKLSQKYFKNKFDLELTKVETALVNKWFKTLKRTYPL